MSFFLVFLLFLHPGMDLSKSSLQEALKKVGLTESDLGYSPKGYWSRYPDPKRIPYKLPFFDDLFKEPLEIPIFLRSLAHVSDDYLGKDYKKNDALYQCLYFFGVEKRVGVFRNYGANLSPQISEKDPLFWAYLKFLEGISSQENALSFGGQYEEADTLKKLLSQIPEPVRCTLAKLLLNMLDSYKWWKISVKGVDKGLLASLMNIKDLDETQSGGSIYYPEIDEIEKNLDEASLAYSALKLAQAGEDASSELDSIIRSKEINPFRVDLETPIGKIAFENGINSEYKDGDYLLIVDLSGKDTYVGKIASGDFNTPISLLIDLSGNDTYRGDSTFGTQGAGIGGVGVLIDRKGNDTYKAFKGAQGYGLMGYGILWDIEGRDSYRIETQGQGCGMLGIGLLLESQGDDNYYLFGNGQGDGEFGGIGVLADREGDDLYKAEPLSSVFDRGDYHSKGKINANNAQGFGGGRRGDGSDGHSWAGGMGLLIDNSGNDRYESGNWSQGCGYWYGIGALFDGSGDDVYHSCYFTQASGAHYSIGAIIDEFGDDRHELFETAGAGLAFGWDFTIAYFEDDYGNDLYDAKIISLSSAEIRSNAIFIELGGDDTYKVNYSTVKLGASDFRKGYRIPNRYSPYGYFRYSKSIALFLDLGGQDNYVLKATPEGKPLPFKNNAIWFQPNPGDTTFGFGNYGVGWDKEAGEIPEINIWGNKPQIQR